MWQRIGLYLVGCVMLLALAGTPAVLRGQKDDGKKKKGLPVEVDKAALRQAALKRALVKAEQDYRVFFKAPTTGIEFWAAINFEMQTGKFDVAGLLLAQMLKKQPAEPIDNDLLTIEDAEGMNVFLRLQEVRRWYDNPELQTEAENNVKSLIDRITVALDRKLSDPERIRKFIKNLSAPTPQQRAFALAQLKRARERVTPYFIEALRATAGTPEHHRLIEVMLELDRDIVPPFLEVLKAQSPADYKDVDLRLALLEILKKRADPRCLPYLWHLSASKRYPELVRQRAKELLAYLQEMDVSKLPPAKVALTALAERYYEHRVRFSDPERVRIWEWDGKKIDPKPVVLKASQAEEFFGQRYAREALDLDPTYRPAQVAYLNLTLERNLNDRLEHLFVPSKDAEVQQPIQAINQLLKTVDADLLLTALKRALAEHNLAVALPIIQALGARGETRAAQPSPTGGTGLLVNALFYPDRRVQFAAATALLNLPTEKALVTSTRLVDVLRRFTAGGTQPKALIVFVNDERGAKWSQVLADAGYSATVTPNLKEAFKRLRESADYDVILVNDTVPESDLPEVLAQLRRDADAGTMPILLLAPAKRREGLARFSTGRRNVFVLPEAYAFNKAELKREIETAVKTVQQPETYRKAPLEARRWLNADFRKSPPQPWSKAERAQAARQSLDALRRMAIGELPGYDVRRAEPEVLAALRHDATAPLALEILGRFPGSPAQQHLAEVVLDGKRDKGLRIQAAAELNRHVKQFGVSLPKERSLDLRALFGSPKTDATLRSQLAILVGNLRPTTLQTGQRLIGFDPLAK